MMEVIIPLGIGIVVGIGLLASGIRIIRPTERGLVERLGNYHRYANAG